MMRLLPLFAVLSAASAISCSDYPSYYVPRNVTPVVVTSLEVR